MNVFQAVKESVSTREAAEAYGIRVNRNGMACCPFHDDHTPSLKLDQRYHCFGCGADGDVIDFTAQLFGTGKKEAAVKIASDFGISYDDGRMSESDGKSNAKGRKKKVRRFSPEYRFAETERRFFRILTDYYHLLCRWREEDAPKTPEEEWGRRFTDSLRDMTLVEYLMDTMLTGTLEEKIDLMNGYREKVKEYERILEEDSGGKTGSAGGDDGGLWAGRAA